MAIIPFVEIWLWICAPAVVPPGFPQWGQLQAVSGISRSHSEHVFGAILACPFVAQP